MGFQAEIYDIKAYIIENIGKGCTSNFFPTVRPPSRLLTASR
jgi:hypothetical protein